jgi:hypothetical protein
MTKGVSRIREEGVGDSGVSTGRIGFSVSGTMEVVGDVPVGKGVSNPGEGVLVDVVGSLVVGLFVFVAGFVKRSGFFLGWVFVRSLGKVVADVANDECASVMNSFGYSRLHAVGRKSSTSDFGSLAYAAHIFDLNKE